jgi:hypothetical protein
MRLSDFEETWDIVVEEEKTLEMNYDWVASFISGSTNKLKVLGVPGCLNALHPGFQALDALSRQREPFEGETIWRTKR